METLIDVGEVREGAQAARPMRVLTIFVAVALVLGGVALARSAGSNPSQPKVTSSREVPGVDGVGAVLGRSLGFGAPVAQISITAIVCPILEALANGPLASFIGPIINALRATFGCTSP